MCPAVRRPEASPAAPAGGPRAETTSVHDVDAMLLAKDVHFLKGTLAEKDETMRTLSVQVDAMQSTAVNTQQLLVQAHMQNHALEESVAGSESRHRDEIDQLVQQLEVHGRSKADAQDSIASLMAGLDQANQREAAESRRADDLTESLRDMVAKLENVLGDKKSVEEQLEAVENQAKEVMRDLDSHKDMVVVNVAAISELEKKCAESAETITKFQLANDRFAEQTVELETMVRSQRSSVSAETLRNQELLRNAEAEIGNSEAERAVAESAASEMLQALEQSTATLSEEKSKRSELEATLREMQSQVAHREDKVRAWQQSDSAAKLALETAKATSENMRGQLRDLELERNQFQQEAMAMRSDQAAEFGKLNLDSREQLHAMASAHATAVASLKAEHATGLASVKESVASLKAEHATGLASVKESAESQRQAAVSAAMEKVREHEREVHEHDKKVAQLQFEGESQLAAWEAKHAAVVLDHDQAVTAVRSQYKSTVSKHDHDELIAGQRQGHLEETAQQRREHAEELAIARQETAAARQRHEDKIATAHSEWALKLTDCEMQSRSSLQQAEGSMAEQHNQALSDMRQRHEEQLTQARAHIDIEKESAMAGSQAEMRSKLAETEMLSRLKVRDCEISMAEKHDQALSILRQAHEDRLAKMHAIYRSEREAAVAGTHAECEGKMLQSQTQSHNKVQDLTEAHERKVAAMKDDHGSHVQSLTVKIKEHEVSMAATKLSHDTRLRAAAESESSLADRHGQMLSKLQEESERKAMSLTSVHEAAVVSHGDTVSRLEQSIAAMREEHQRTLTGVHSTTTATIVHTENMDCPLTRWP